MKQPNVVAIAIAQDYLVASKYALKVMGVYVDKDNAFRWYTYNVLQRSKNLDMLVQEGYKLANNMKVPYLRGVKSTGLVSREHIEVLKRRGLICPV